MDPFAKSAPRHRLRKAMISELTTRQSSCAATAVQEDSVQHGSVIKSERKYGPAVW
jgi:hypothetical protein